MSGGSEHLRFWFHKLWYTAESDRQGSDTSWNQILGDQIPHGMRSSGVWYHMESNPKSLIPHEIRSSRIWYRPESDPNGPIEFKFDAAGAIGSPSNHIFPFSGVFSCHVLLFPTLTFHRCIFSAWCPGCPMRAPEISGFFQDSRMRTKLKLTIFKTWELCPSVWFKKFTSKKMWPLCYWHTCEYTLNRVSYKINHVQ